MYAFRTAIVQSKKIIACFLRGQHSSSSMTHLNKLVFDNLALKKLPIDSETNNYVRQVCGACFSLVKPTPVDNPIVVAYSISALNLLDLSGSDVAEDQFVQYFGGNEIFDGSQTASHCYCGHQFGNFAGQLGDGAAM